MNSIKAIIFSNYMICEVYQSHPWRHEYPDCGFRRKDKESLWCSKKRPKTLKKVVFFSVNITIKTTAFEFLCLGQIGRFDLQWVAVEHYFGGDVFSSTRLPLWWREMGLDYAIPDLLPYQLYFFFQMVMNIILFCRIIMVDFSDVLWLGGSRSREDQQHPEKPATNNGTNSNNQTTNGIAKPSADERKKLE